MPSTIKDAINAKKTGFHIGQRLVLPFRCQIIKMMVKGELFTELVGSNNVKIQQDPKNTSIYFRLSGKLDNLVGTYRVIKLIVCEWDVDICDVSKHIKLVCEMEENHVTIIHEPSDDMLFIE